MGVRPLADGIDRAEDIEANPEPKTLARPFYWLFLEPSPRPVHVISDRRCVRYAFHRHQFLVRLRFKL